MGGETVVTVGPCLMPYFELSYRPSEACHWFNFSARRFLSTRRKEDVLSKWHRGMSFYGVFCFIK